MRGASPVRPLRVGVVGAGVGGAALASCLALARERPLGAGGGSGAAATKNAKVELTFFERRPDKADGGALRIRGEGAEVLDALGLLGPLQAVTASEELMVTRDTLVNQLLARATGRADVRFVTEVARITDTDSEVHIEHKPFLVLRDGMWVRNESSTLSRDAFDIVVAADGNGASSRGARQIVGEAAAQAQAMSLMVFQALAPCYSAAPSACQEEYFQQGLRGSVGRVSFGTAVGQAGDSEARRSAFERLGRLSAAVGDEAAIALATGSLEADVRASQKNTSFVRHWFQTFSSEADVQALDRRPNALRQGPQRTDTLLSSQGVPPWDICRWVVCTVAVRMQDAMRNFPRQQLWADTMQGHISQCRNATLRAQASSLVERAGNPQSGGRIYAWVPYEKADIGRWFSESGRVVALGDAAAPRHAADLAADLAAHLLPATAGWGASVALADARRLAVELDKLAQVPRLSRAALRAAFSAYEAERREAIEPCAKASAAEALKLTGA